MPGTLLKSLTEDEYLSLDERSEERHEFVGGQVFAMTGSTRTHNRITRNLLVVLDAACRETGCDLYATDRRLKVETQDSYYYPDVMLVCERTADSERYETRPCVIFEVLSSSTEQVDRREKRIAYFSLPSLRQYCLLSQHEQRVLCYRRFSADEWQAEELTAGGLLLVECLQREFAVAAFYAGVAQGGIDQVSASGD